MAVSRLARMTVLTVALLCVFTICAGGAVAHLMPARLALFELPEVSAAGLATPGPGPASAAGTGQATRAGVTAKIAGPIAAGGLGPDTGALVADLRTGQVLYSHNASTAFAPASTTKIATAIAAIDVLGPGARFTTSVALVTAPPGGTPAIVLNGGGDPVLAAGPYPAGDYPHPATLARLAARTAAALRRKGISSVRLRYYDGLFTGPVTAQGWPDPAGSGSYVATGNITPITGLEVDQGRLTLSGKPEDSDDGANFRPRSATPSLDAAHAFARFLRSDGISLHGAAAPAAAPGHGAAIALVRSPQLTAIVQQMLSESNNVIAETLGRQVAIATGKAATFSGAASAVMAADRGLGVAGIGLKDTSGLSPMDRITPKALVGLVRLAAGTGQQKLRSVITGLPVAGFSGTLGPGSFFGPFGQPGLGMVRAKTGNLSHVATMAGIAYTASGQLLAFAFMGNDIPASMGLQPEGTLAQLATGLASCGCG